LIAISVLIATPLTWIVMERWLQGFPYRIQVQPRVFLFTALLSLLLALAAVSIQTLRAAARNPSESLRYE
jgi:putative ABC transport system permease protein